jgi:hypothetical protein
VKSASRQRRHGGSEAASAQTTSTRLDIACCGGCAACAAGDKAALKAMKTQAKIRAGKKHETGGRGHRNNSIAFSK